MSVTQTAQLPGNLKSNPRLGQWLHIDAGGFIEISPGKVEIGQGILTALMQIAADELDISPARVRLRAVNTVTSPNEGVTSGSLSIQDSGSAIRRVCAQARAIYLALAAEKLGVEAGALVLDDGTIRGPKNLSTSYWELANDTLLDRDASLGVKAKSPDARVVAGASAQRLDIPEKAFGLPRFIHDKYYKDVLHGRVLRPPGPRARLVSLDESAAIKIVGVMHIVRDGSFVGVVASSESATLQAIEALRKNAQWTEQGNRVKKSVTIW